jgi:hypothetical protein
LIITKKERFEKGMYIFAAILVLGVKNPRLKGNAVQISDSPSYCKFFLLNPPKGGLSRFFEKMPL